MPEYDATLKLLLERSAERSLRQLTGTAIARWLNIDLPEMGNRLGETAEGELIHIELQGHNDTAMALRMAAYCLRIYRLMRAFPRQVVRYVGRDPLRMPAEPMGPRFSFRYDLADPLDIDGEPLRASDQLAMMRLRS